MKKIAFWTNQLCERGTTIGIFNYAHYNETILNNKSIILYEKNNILNKQKVIEKFNNHFKLFPVNDFSVVDKILVENNISHIFIIKSGENDGKISKVANNCIQCVFDCYTPHGEVYCSISESIKGNNGKFPVIPRIITLPDNNGNLRQELNIPKDSIVFGGYGGSDKFNIPFVQKVVYNIARENPNIYFLFAHFKKFCNQLPNIIYLPTIYNLDNKVKFINTCDAMLWARKDGETFGQSIAEFSIKNKPVIAMKIGDIAHVKLLGDKAIWYSNKNNLTDILLNFNPEIESKKDWNAYRGYTPEKVMKIFNDVFLEEK